MSALSITDHLTLTHQLAIALGVYMVSAGATGFVYPGRWTAILDEFRTRPALTYISGIVVYALGVALVTVHTVWTDPFAILVTLIGYVAALEGLVLIFAPEVLLRFADGLLNVANVTVFAAVSVGLGALLIGLGFAGVGG